MKYITFISAFIFAISVQAATVKDGYEAVKNKNYKTGFSILSHHAENGDPNAQYGLGILYRQGWGTEKDLEKAIFYYQKAAAQEHVGAIFDIGWSYQSGEGVEQNHSKAAVWFEKAAELGHPVAMYGLGGLLLNGLGVEKNVELAKSWYHKSAQAGYPPAIQFVKKFEKAYNKAN